MKKIRISIFAMCLFLLSACQEEIRVDWRDVEVGKPALMDLAIEVPQGETLKTRGASAYESVINTMSLVMFEQSTGQKHYVNLTGKLVSATMSQEDLDRGYRTYTLTAPVEVLSGNYHVYAVANMESAFSPMRHEVSISDLDETEDEFLSRTVKTSTAVWDPGNGYLPMSAKHVGSGDNGDMVTIYPKDVVESGEAANTKISLKMRRLTSRIEFNFVNGADAPNATNAVKTENPQFTPMTFRIYNIPKQSYLMDQTIAKHSGNINSATAALPTNPNVINGLGAAAYAHSDEISIAGDRAVNFFMLENIKSATGCSAYEDRDTWDSPGYTNDDDAAGNTQTTNPEDKNFTNAPEYSTFVVVSGEYTSSTYIGDVTYTIHLGNFSATSTDRSVAGFNNFSVNRNENHVYTITVNGVNTIVTESEVENDEIGGDKPGVEGTVTKVSKGTQFVLDAHYERVMLKFKLDSKCSNPTVMVQSPYSPNKELVEYNLMPAANSPQEEALKTADINWVKFMAPTSTTSFPNYPSTTNQSTQLVDIVGLAKELQSAWNNNNPINSAPSGAHYLMQRDGEDIIIYVVAYIDEYFYETEPGTDIEADWRDFTNENNRIMILNPLKQISPDGNSTSYPDYIFQISQRSIKTTYADNGVPLGNEGVYMPFGIETWNETGILSFGTPSSTTGLSDDNGWQNTKTLLVGGRTDRTWQNAVYTHNAGYLTGINDNSKESHRYYSTGNGVRNMYAYYACMTRNRDENGDGNINDDEIKWYLPAVDQYVTIWLNNDLLYEDTQLFDPSGDALTTLSRRVSVNSNLYTSSSDDHRLYWPVEGGSYGQENRQWSNTSNGVRCVRNLVANGNNGGKALYSGTPTPATEHDASLRRIHSVNISSKTLRTNPVTQYTPRHTERHVDNRLPEYFVYAAANLTNSMAGATGTENYTMNKQALQTYTEDPCTKYYYEANDKSDLGKWRIPNQRELMLIVTHLGNIGDLTSSTFMSNWEKGDADFDVPFGAAGGTMTADTKANSGNINVRCVRDDNEHGFEGGDGGDTGDGGSEGDIDAANADASYDVTGKTIF